MHHAPVGGVASGGGAAAAPCRWCAERRHGRGWRWGRSGDRWRCARQRQRGGGFPRRRSGVVAAADDRHRVGHLHGAGVAAAADAARDGSAIRTAGAVGDRLAEGRAIRCEAGACYPAVPGGVAAAGDAHRVPNPHARARLAAGRLRGLRAPWLTTEPTGGGFSLRRPRGVAAAVDGHCSPAFGQGVPAAVDKHVVWHSHGRGVAADRWCGVAAAGDGHRVPNPHARAWLAAGRLRGSQAPCPATESRGGGFLLQRPQGVAAAVDGHRGPAYGEGAPTAGDEHHVRHPHGGGVAAAKDGCADRAVEARLRPETGAPTAQRRRNRSSGRGRPEDRRR